MQSLTRWISGGSTKNKESTSPTGSSALATSPSNTGYLGPPLTAAQSRAVMEAAESSKPMLGRMPIKAKERRGSWHEGTEYLGV